MNIGKTLFAQMMDFLPWKSFHRIVARYSGDYRVRTLPEAGAFYVMDRGYLDFERLHGLDQAGAFFVVRAKSNLDARGLYSAPIERSTGLICDQTIVLNGLYSSQHYPQHLRRIRFKDPGSGKTLVVLTHHFRLPALTVCALHQEPLASRAVLQIDRAAPAHQALLSHLGERGEDQIWIAVSVYVLVAIIRTRLNLDVSGHMLLQIFSLTVFEKIQLTQAVTSHESTRRSPIPGTG
jgi:hypothetical protein